MSSTTTIDPIDLVLDILKRACGNLDWAQAKACLLTLGHVAQGSPGIEQQIALTLQQVMELAVSGLEIETTGAKWADREPGLRKLEAACGLLVRLREEHTELLKDARVKDVYWRIKGRVLMLEMAEAYLQQNWELLQRLHSQRRQLVDEAIAGYPEGSSNWHRVKATRVYWDIQEKLASSRRAVEVMDFASAEMLASGASQLAGEMEKHLKEADAGTAMADAWQRMLEGCSKAARAQAMLTGTVQAVILGCVTRAHIDQLILAGQAYADAGELMASSARVVAGVDGAELRAEGQAAAARASNLRAVCERSLSLRRTTRAAGVMSIPGVLGSMATLAAIVEKLTSLREITTSRMALAVLAGVVVTAVAAIVIQGLRYLGKRSSGQARTDPEQRKS